MNASEGETATFESAKSNMGQGWGTSFDQLDAYLLKQKQ
jgi:hypothetical protein